MDGLEMPKGGERKAPFENSNGIVVKHLDYVRMVHEKSQHPQCNVYEESEQQSYPENANASRCTSGHSIIASYSFALTTCPLPLGLRHPHLTHLDRQVVASDPSLMQP